MSEPSPRQPPRRHALLVATTAYEDADWAALRSPAADAEGLAAALADPAIGAFEVTTILDGTVPVIRSALDEFLSDRTREDFLLLYFSCHGFREAGEFYFAARDTVKRRLRATGLEGQFVHRLLNHSAAERVVVVLDCCYSGSFPRGAKGLTTDVAYLSELVCGTGRAIITASGSIENAYEDTGTLISSHPAPSIFTEALIHGLRSGLADIDGDGQVAVQEWFEYATGRLRRRGAAQTPHMWNAEIVGKLFVARNPFFRAPAAAAVPVRTAGDGVLARLAAFAERLGGRGLARAVVDLVDQVRAILRTARMPSAWWAVLGALQELSDGGDADGVVAQLVDALRRLEQDPTMVETATEILDGLERLVGDPAFAEALHTLLRALEIAVGTGQDLLKRIVTNEVSRRAYSVARELTTRFLVEPEVADDVALPQPASPDGQEEPDSTATPQQWAAKLIESARRLAHAVRGLAGYEALRQAAGDYAAAVAPNRTLAALAAPGAERLADLILELTLSVRRYVEGAGGPVIKRKIDAFFDDVSDYVRESRKDGSHTAELVDCLEIFTDMFAGLTEAVMGPGLATELQSAIDAMQQDPLTQEEVKELFDELGEGVESAIEAIHKLEG